MITSALSLALSVLGQTSFEETILFHPAPIQTVSFGRRIALGDADNDGEVDLFASNPFHDQGRGAGWVLYGPEFTTSRMFTVPVLVPDSGGFGGDWFGFGMWQVVDLNGDGFADVVAGAAGPGAGMQYHGRAFAVYGPDYTSWVEMQHPGPVFTASFGFLGDVGDVTGDDIPDILVGSQGWPNGGRIDVFDGATGYAGPPAQVLVPPDPSAVLNDQAFGFGVLVADFTGDGKRDVLTSHTVLHHGAIHHLGILDGGDPQKIVPIAPATIAPFFNLGRTFAFVDVNHDGLRDIVCGAKNGLQPKNNLVAILWGPDYLTGTTRESSLPSQDDRFYRFGLGDVQRDGKLDLVVGSAGSDGNGNDAGRAAVLKGPSFVQTHVWNGTGSQAQRGESIAVADTDGDGFAEFFVGCPLEGYGLVRVYRHHTLRALTTPEISIAQGGVVPLSIECGQLSASDGYYLLASASGSAPGFDVTSGEGTVHVPLNIDILTVQALALGNNSIFQAFQGITDAEGDALATFAVPAGLATPSLIGIELTFAAVLTDPPGCIDYATRAVEVTFVP